MGDLGKIIFATGFKKAPNLVTLFLFHRGVGWLLGLNGLKIIAIDTVHMQFALCISSLLVSFLDGPFPASFSLFSSFQYI